MELSLVFTALLQGNESNKWRAGKAIVADQPIVVANQRSTGAGPAVAKGGNERGRGFEISDSRSGLKRSNRGGNMIKPSSLLLHEGRGEI
jgi:hypothetical protein